MTSFYWFVIDWTENGFKLMKGGALGGNQPRPKGTPVLPHFIFGTSEKFDCGTQTVVLLQYRFSGWSLEGYDRGGDGSEILHDKTRKPKS